MFRNKSVSKVLSAFREIEKNIDIQGLNFIRDEVLSTLKDKEVVERCLIEEDIPPIAIVYCAISDIAYNALALGTYHTYRGILGMKGTQVLSLFNFASKQKIKYDLLTEVELKDEVIKLKKLIAEVG